MNNIRIVSRRLHRDVAEPLPSDTPSFVDFCGSLISPASSSAFVFAEVRSGTRDGCGASVPGVFSTALPWVSGLLRTDDLVGNLLPVSSLTNTQWFNGISALCELKQVCAVISYSRPKGVLRWKNGSVNRQGNSFYCSDMFTFFAHLVSLLCTGGKANRSQVILVPNFLSATVRKAFGLRRTYTM